ncbi:spore germination protein GerPE [Paenibacillus sp. GSMTC-2017]|uniref:spore germination protein GerPE n=1 Tax=Paenibacillus sp. GSMTC-2017 TaxID=2794350 RepID=UPI0018D80844|nr:spore germination protein GerPE [Paenibacillus sp. GSMTC-2017]MBH5318099.1 spore germination protein GerPE [Paenibacillus sp. GSMTC-2017]
MVNNTSQYYNETTYPIRTSEVGIVSIINASSSTTIQFGDRGETNGKLQALAIQRATDHTTSGNVYFESYRIFNRPRPELIDPVYDAGDAIYVNRTNRSPAILVGCIRVIAIGASSSLHIGNSKRVIEDSRIKHIRQFPLDHPPT